ncbi:Protein of unknown function, partial [Cotesia congregata]
IKYSNIEKFNKLVKDSAVYVIGGNQDKFVYNFTDVILPEKVLNTLKLEPKFGIPLRNSVSAVPTIIKDIEFCIQIADVLGETIKIVEENRNKIRSEVVNVLMNFLKKKEPREYDDVRKNIMKTRRFLREHDELIVTRSDKGGSTVVMSKEEYINGMNNMLSDTNTYEKLTKDPTSKFQSNDIVKELLAEKEIDEADAKYLKTHNAIASKIYDLRKTPKVGFALRPVVSCVGTPSYKLASFVHRILAAWTDESFTDENLMRVRGLLRNNNYLVGFVNKVIALFLRKRDVRIENVDINVKKSYKFPFIKGLSFKIDHCLKDANAKLVLYNLYTIYVHNTINYRTDTQKLSTRLICNE